MRKTFESSGFECIITTEKYTIQLPPSRHHEMDGIGNGEMRTAYRYRVIGKVAGKEVYKKDELISDSEVLNAVKACERELKESAKFTKAAEKELTLTDKLKKQGFE